MHSIFLYTQAIQSDRERGYESEEHRMLMEASALQTSDPSHLRRAMALALAALSRGSAAAVRRLDECVADDLGRALAPSD
jgi:hypothetical protein